MHNTINTYVSDSKFQEHVGRAYHGIGVTYMEEGNMEAAVRAFEKALEYKENSGSRFITKYDLGTVLKNNGQVDKAITVWKDALDEKHDKNSIEQVKIYADLTSALKMNDEYEEALSYSEVYQSSIQNIIQEGEQYKAKNDQVLFANIIKEYEEFKQPVPFFTRPSVILVMVLSSISVVYLLMILYYRSKSKRKVSEAVSNIQARFLDIKVD